MSQTIYWALLTFLNCSLSLWLRSPLLAGPLDVWRLGFACVSTVVFHFDCALSPSFGRSTRRMMTAIASARSGKPHWRKVSPWPPSPWACSALSRAHSTSYSFSWCRHSRDAWRRKWCGGSFVGTSLAECGEIANVARATPRLSQDPTTRERREQPSDARRPKERNDNSPHRFGEVEADRVCYHLSNLVVESWTWSTRRGHRCSAVTIFAREQI